MTDTSNSHPIVVGVDGSESSKEALRWAGDQARRTGAPLKAIAVWHVPMVAYGAAMPMPISDDIDRDAEKALDATVGEILGDPPGLTVTTTVRRGHPAQVLVDEAAGAQLLVVGSRGHGAFAGMLLGSVSAYCAAHAACPVVIVRHANES